MNKLPPDLVSKAKVEELLEIYRRGFGRRPPDRSAGIRTMQVPSAFGGVSPIKMIRRTPCESQVGGPAYCGSVPWQRVG